MLSLISQNAAGLWWWRKVVGTLFEYRHDNEMFFDAGPQRWVNWEKTFLEKIITLANCVKRTCAKPFAGRNKKVSADCSEMWSMACTCAYQYAKTERRQWFTESLPKAKLNVLDFPGTFGRLSFTVAMAQAIWFAGLVWTYMEVPERWRHYVDGKGCQTCFAKKVWTLQWAHVIGSRSPGRVACIFEKSVKSRTGKNWTRLHLLCLCNGESIMMQLIHDELIVSNKIGGSAGGNPQAAIAARYLKKWQRKLMVAANGRFLKTIPLIWEKKMTWRGVFSCIACNCSN